LPTDNAFVNQFFNLLFGRPQQQDALFHFVTRLCWQTDQSVMSYRYRLVKEFDFGAKVERIQAPTLIVSGDRDVLVSRKSHRELANGIKGARSARLPGCGHLAFLTHPELVADKVMKFISPD